MHQGLFIPGHDFVSNLAHDLEHFSAAGRHALGKIHAPGE